MDKIEPKSLETRLERPDWKQWLPIYGVYRVLKDAKDNKPNILNPDGAPIIFYGASAYQAISIVGLINGITYLPELAQKLL